MRAVRTVSAVRTDPVLFCVPPEMLEVKLYLPFLLRTAKRVVSPLALAAPRFRPGIGSLDSSTTSWNQQHELDFQSRMIGLEANKATRET